MVGNRRGKAYDKGMVKVSRGRDNHRGQKKRRMNGPVVTSEMRVADLIALVPQAERVLAEYGLHCVHCSIGGLEMLGDGCRLHGFGDEEIAELVDDLNALLKEMPARPATLTVTASAARAIGDVREDEGKESRMLVVTTDGQGGFCLEFADEAPQDHRAFAADEGDVTVLASPLTLRRIGGAVIDYREGRFKLDLPET